MKTATTSVGFKDALSVLVANGKLILDLSQAAEVISGGGLIVPTRIVLPLDANAKIASTQIFFNDELTPSGTTYKAVLLNSNGSRIADFGNWSLSGASVDLSTMVPASSTVSYAGAVSLNPTAQQNINGQTLNMEGASLSFSAAASTTADSFFSRLAAGVIGVGTAIANALGTLRAAILQIGGSDTGLSRDSAGVIDVGNGAQGDKSGTMLLSKLGAGGANAGGSSAGDITAARSTTSGAVYLGSDGSGFLFRNGNTVTLQGTSLVWTMPAATDTLVGQSTTDTLKNKDLTAAGSGNKSTLLNSQDTLGNLTGNGTDQTIYTFTIPANTIQAGKGFRIRMHVISNNAVACTFKLTIGSTTATIAASTGINNIDFQLEVFNNAGVQNAQRGMGFAFEGTAIIGNTTFTMAENFANALAVKITANEANPNTITPNKWFMELIQ